MTSAAAFYRIVFVDGILDREQSQIADLPIGVSMEQDAGGHGMLLSFAPAVIIDKPVQLIFSGMCFQPMQYQIVVGAGSQAVVIEQHATAASSIMQIHSEWIIHAAAQLTHYKIQNAAVGVQHIAVTRASQFQDSQLTSYVFSLGARVAREDLMLVSHATGTRTQAYGLYVVGQADSTQRMEHHTHIHHRASDGSSHQLYKGIVGGDGHAVFRGKVEVDPHALHIVADQRNHNILLSDHAVVDTAPELKIHAGDIRCSHGATVGQLNDDAVFYLRSRGMDVSDAKAILLRAFVSEILDSIPSIMIADYIHDSIEPYVRADYLC